MYLFIFNHNCKRLYIFNIKKKFHEFKSFSRFYNKYGFCSKPGLRIYEFVIVFKVGIITEIMNSVNVTISDINLKICSVPKYLICSKSRHVLKRLKVTIYHFRKIGGCLDGNQLLSLVLVFISPKCLKPVELANNLAQNRIMSI